MAIKKDVLLQLSVIGIVGLVAIAGVIITLGANDSLPDFSIKELVYRMQSPAQYLTGQVISSMISKETIRCYFKGSNVRESCTSGSSSCVGLRSCAVTASGVRGMQFIWTSSCPGTATTTTDGKTKNIYFDCSLKCTAGWKCQSANYRAYQNTNCLWSNTSIQYCPSGCSNGICKPASASSCAAGWKCFSSTTRGYQNANCSWSNSSFAFCPAGCMDGQCVIANNTNNTNISLPKNTSGNLSNNSGSMPCKFEAYTGQMFVPSLRKTALVASIAECQQLGVSWKQDACQYQGIYTNYLFYQSKDSIDPNTWLQTNIPGGNCCCVNGSSCVACTGAKPPYPTSTPDPDCGTAGCSCVFQPYNGQAFEPSLERSATVMNPFECQNLAATWKNASCGSDKNIYTNYLFYKGGQVPVPTGDCCCMNGTSCVLCTPKKTCTAGWSCFSNTTKGYQMPDCSWSNQTFSYCQYGCANGQCNGVANNNTLNLNNNTGSLRCMFNAQHNTGFSIPAFQRTASVAAVEECAQLAVQWKQEACKYQDVLYTQLYYFNNNGGYWTGYGIPGGDCCCPSNNACYACSGTKLPIPDVPDPDCGTAGCQCRFEAYNGTAYVPSLHRSALVMSPLECRSLGVGWKNASCASGLKVYTNYLIYKVSQIRIPAGDCCCVNGNTCIRCP
jgi:hypothetical protein